jgi:hypothetical protein
MLTNVLHERTGLGVNGGGSGPVIYDGPSSNVTAARHAPSVVPVASTQFVASATFVRDPSSYIGAGALATPAPVLTRMYTPVSVVGTAPAEIVSPVLGPASVAAAVIAPVVTAVPQAGVVARAPFIAPDAAGLIPCQFNATPQPAPPPQFPAPHPPQFPAYSSYPPPPVSEGVSLKPVPLLHLRLCACKLLSLVQRSVIGEADDSVRLASYIETYSRKALVL